MATTTSQPLEEGKHLHHGGRHLPSVYRAGTAPPPLPRLEMPPSSSSSSSRKITVEAQQALKTTHSEAERRRRERINAHLATLRRMVPDAGQMDKATLLSRVVCQLKDLKKKSAETTQPPSQAIIIPAETNGIAVHCYTAGAAAAAIGAYGRPPPAATYVIRASVSCDDRPGLHADLAAAFRAMRLRPLRADMAALGGRAHCDFLLCREEEGGGCRVQLRAIEEGVRQALARAAFPETEETPPCGCNAARSSRQRLVGSNCVLLGRGHGVHVRDREHGW